MAETFYGQIAENRRNSTLLALVVIALFGVLGFAIGYAITGYASGALGVRGLAVLLGSLAAAGSYFGGDSRVLSVSGAKGVDEAAAPQLLNGVREMSSAANAQMPQLSVTDATAPHAFAPGRDPTPDSVAIPTGLLDQLDREE